MRRGSVIRPGLAGGVATALTVSTVGFVLAGAAPALATGAPACDNPGLVSDPTHPLDNHDGTSSVVLVATSATATATIALPAGVKSAQLDLCGAQGTATTVNGGLGGRTTASITVTGGNSLVLLAGGTTTGGTPGPGGGEGGGFSAVYLGTTASRAAAIAYAGGGGGAGGGEGSSPFDGDGGAGGAGGGHQAADGQFGSGAKNGTGDTGVPGGGASETAPGQGGVAADPATSGSDGGQNSGGAGGTGTGTANGGGGGGGGWFGGGGGAGGSDANMGSEFDGGGGGGGGSGHVTNLAGAIAGQSFTGVRVDGGAVVLTYNNPSPPAFGSGFADTVLVGTAYTRTVSVSAVDTATITIDSGALPHGITFVDNGNNSATLSGTPDVPGHYPFRLRASNGAPPDATQDEVIDVLASPGATAPPSPSPSPSRSATPTATTSATATATTPPGGLTLRTRTPDIQPNQTALLDVTGAGNSVVELRCYTRPSTTYFTARTQSSSGGSLQFSILPGANTRCYARFPGNEASASDSVVINVHTTLSLSAYRDGVRRYHFQGTNLPRRAGQLITLYRWARRDNNGFCDPHVVRGDYNATSSDPNCVAIRTAAASTNSSNVWRIDRTFTGSGQFVFMVRTSQNLTNAAGVSNQRLTIIH
ncbi:MAG: hypothetical protein QOI82_1673 [Actinomycetota bacterium]|jgi:hypothetical protein|nr:hypothetical protein [Actinomycetota bacterium]